MTLLLIVMDPPVTPGPVLASTTNELIPLAEFEPMGAAIVTLELFADTPANKAILNDAAAPVDVEEIGLLIVILLFASNVSVTAVAEPKLKAGEIAPLTVIFPVPVMLPLLVVMVTLSPFSRAVSIVPVSAVPA